MMIQEATLPDSKLLPQTSAIGSAFGADKSTGTFITLLVAQIKNQNPLQPSDPSAFVGQLTQLSQMEAMQQMASQARTGKHQLDSLQALGLGARVGSLVSASADTVQLGKNAVDGVLRLSQPAGQLSLLLNRDDGLVKRIDLGAQPAGAVAFRLDPAELGSGHFRLQLEQDGQPAELAAELNGALQRVRLGSDGALASVDVAGLGELPASAITGIGITPSSVPDKENP